jgi:hypothetical protein
MISIVFRSADEDDISAFIGGRGSPYRNIVLVSIPVSLFIFAAIGIVFRSWFVASLIAITFFVSSLYGNLSFFRDVVRRRKLKSDPTAVEAIKIKPARVFELQALGDHAPAYCFCADDNQVLLLAGQWLLETPLFPNTEFTVCRWADNQRPIRIKIVGERTNAEVSKVEIRDYYGAPEAVLVQAKIESLQEDLDNFFERNRSR